MKRTLESLAAITLLLIAGCTSSAETERPVVVENPFEGSLESVPLAFEVDQVFGAEEEPQEEVLARVRDVEVDEGGNVYVLGNDRVVAFARDGTFRWEIDGQGDGPGELSRASRIALHPSGDLYVDNQFATRYEVFSNDGSFIRSIPVNTMGHNRISLVGFIDDSTAVGHRAMSGVLGTTVMVLDTGEEWSVRREFVVDQEEDPEIPEFLTREPDVELLGNHIALTNVVRYEISILTLEGDTVRVVRRDAPDYLRPGVATFENGQRGTALFSSLEGPVRLGTGHYVTSGFWPTNVTDPDEAATLAFRGEAAPADFYRTLDIYDADWQLLYSVDREAFEELGVEEVAVTGDEAFLYTMEIEPYPRVVRYRVVESSN